MTSAIVSVNKDGRFQLEYDPADHEFVAQALYELQEVLDGRSKDRKLVAQHVR